ncbi:MAG: hypothetical protein CSA49_07300 [Gammaproteobacteria bacterium]|nr:MAG: hypothetical protein CSA49_07300 [Gammaproteobacteria bacterium]
MAVKKSVGILIGLVISISLSACGFHLRGYADNNTPQQLQLQQITLNANPNNSFTRILVEQLKANGVSIVADSAMQLVIMTDKNDKRTLSRSRRGKSAEYALVKRITFKVIDKNSAVAVIKPTQLQTQRTLIIDDNRVSATQEQESIMQTEMEQDLASELIMRLQQTKQPAPQSQL